LRTRAGSAWASEGSRPERSSAIANALDAIVKADKSHRAQAVLRAAVKEGGGEAYTHVMLIDGNDDRRIDVGILTRKAYDILSVQSHVDDALKGKRIFSAQGRA
jgi:hypothetical protein